VYRRRRSVLDFTSTGEVSLSFTCFKVVEWFLKRLYTTIGGILVVLSEGIGGALVSLMSDSLSERTANWLGDKKDGEAPLEVGSWPRFRFGHWAG
jgi:hypothetical protein